MQKKPSHDDVMKLIKELIIPFYHIDRDMLVPSSDKRSQRVENDAEHSWSVAMLACILAPHIDTSLDIGLVSQYSLVHDLTEVYAGDTSVWASDKELSQKESSEKHAQAVIAKKYAHIPWIVKTLDEYELQESNEARYVRAIDKYISLCIRFMDKGKFFRKTGTTKARFDRNLEPHRKKASSHKGVLEYYEEIRKIYDEHPEHFAKEDKLS